MVNNNSLNKQLFDKIRSVNVNAVNSLVKKGAPVNTRDTINYVEPFGHMTPLQKAVHSGSAKMVKLLLKAGANPNKFSTTHALGGGLTPGFTALHVAAYHGNADLTKVLIQHGATINAKSSDAIAEKETALMIVTNCHTDPPLYDWLNLNRKTNKYVETAKVLVGAGAKVDIKTGTDKVDSSTPLHVAAEACSPELVTLFLKQRNRTINVNVKDFMGNTPLHGVSENSCEGEEDRKEEVVTALLNAGANVNARNDEKRTPFMLALGKGDYTTALLMIQKKGTQLNINTADEEGQRPFDFLKYHLSRRYRFPRRNPNNNNKSKKNSGKQLRDLMKFFLPERAVRRVGARRGLTKAGIPPNVQKKIMALTGINYRNQLGRPLPGDIPGLEKQLNTKVFFMRMKKAANNRRTKSK